MPYQVTAVHQNLAHRFSKTTVPCIELVAGHGVAGDAHFGVTVKHKSRVAKDPTQPNLRQVHLLHEELFAAVASQGINVSPGDMGENLTTRGIDLLALGTGTRLKVGLTAVIEITGLRVTRADVLGEIGQGFKYAQVRLAPARLTHCMRWLGAAQRAQDIAILHAAQRTAFGKPIGEHEGIGFQLADNDMDLHMARLVTQHGAWVLDQGHDGCMESSRAKVMVSEAVYRVADRCVQVLGGLGLTGDTVVAQIFRETRAFRIYDGPSEVHRWSLSRKLLRAVKGPKKVPA